ncbi:protein neprosin-like [Lolium perenne]|uniref:protein neprosin-like n=1 Tax=Lolium perenne TaxID=4522 RepID=UPI0021F62231|nr:uncharacterized protein LOC127321793 [Lolium perenne]
MAAKIMIRAAIAIMLLLAVGEEASALLIQKIIESDDGDTIDCVAISTEILQPTRSMKAIVADSDIAVAAEERPQSWRKGGAGCPSGTVPIRRSPAANDMNTTEAFSIAGKGAPPPRELSGTVEKAAAYGTNGPYHGIRAEVPVWRVNVNHPDEFSMNYVMIGCTLDTSWLPGIGADPPSSLPNQIMAGVMTWPSVFGDSLSRLFVYYTNDSGVHHNCFNTECGGFQITNTKYSLGTAWSGESQLGGQQYGVYVGIHRDDTKLIWWVSVMDVDIGYFNDTVFDTRFPEGSYVEMGGRVLNTRPGGKHTTTPMGSTIPSCASTLYAASIKRYLGVSALGQLFLDQVDRTVATVPSCYNARHIGFGKKQPGYQTAYGGAGGKFCDL